MLKPLTMLLLAFNVLLVLPIPLIFLFKLQLPVAWRDDATVAHIG